MTIIHAPWIGEQAVLSKNDFERLLQLARQCEQIDVQHSDELSRQAMMKLAASGARLIYGTTRAKTHTPVKTANRFNARFEFYWNPGAPDDVIQPAGRLPVATGASPWIPSMQATMSPSGRLKNQRV